MVEDTEYISNSDARRAVEIAQKSMTTFYRYAREGKIGVQGSGRKRAYNRKDVNAFLNDGLPQDGRKSREVSQSLSVSSMQDISIEALNQSNLLYSFVLQYEQSGFKGAIPMEVMWSWQQIAPVFWCLYESSNPKEVLSLLALLPLSLEHVLSLLKKEIMLQDIKASDIIHSSPTYYMAAVAQSESLDILSPLVNHIFSYWCEKNVHVTSVYTSVEKSLHGSPLAYVVKENFFALRPDIGQGSWMLDLDDFNPSKTIQNYQKCFQDKREETTSMVALPVVDDLQEVISRPVVVKDRVRNFSGFRPLSSDGYITKNARFRRVVSDDDIRAILHINASLFGQSKRSEDELVQARRAWLEKNPEIYHVLEVNSRIVGFLSMFPLPMEEIEKLLSGELVVSQIQAEDILPYEPNHPVDIFVQTLGLDPSIEQESEEQYKRYGSYLIKGLMDLFYRWGGLGVEIHTVYARSDTPYGIYTSRGLGFKSVPPPPGVHKQIFRLDVARSDQPFLMEYMNNLKNYWKARALKA